MGGRLAATWDTRLRHGRPPSLRHGAGKWRGACAPAHRSSRLLPGDGLPLCRLTQAVVDVLCDHLWGGEVKDQRRRQGDSGELLGERVLEFDGGQTVQAGVHEGRVARKRLGADEAQGYIQDRGSQHLLARALILLFARVDKLEQLVDQGLARGVPELLEDCEGLIARILCGVVFVIHEVHLRHQRAVVCLTLLVAALDAHSNALIDLMPCFIDLVGHHVHLCQERQALRDEHVVL
mmetsp:Transcript_17580/g.53118  ORF Transcript_17580/g.53118 Transcript_17580/m.53118 type:complete len:236 (-) Transcript_17580:889-1596(-)